VCGKSLGSLLSMIIGRYLLRDAVERFIFKRFPLVRTIGRAIEKEGFGALVLIRGMPFAMALKNYGLSVLRGVSISSALLAGSITAVPHSFVWATIGSSAKDVAELSMHNVSMADAVKSVLPGPAMWAVGFVVLAVSVYLSRSLARRFTELMNSVDDDISASGAPAAKLHNGGVHQVYLNGGSETLAKRPLRVAKRKASRSPYKPKAR